MKIISIDYDDTYTLIPKLFDLIIDYCIKNKIKIIMCTARGEHEKDNILLNLEKKIDVYYTNRQYKKEFLNKKGIYPDIWMDDNPVWIIGSELELSI